MSVFSEPAIENITVQTGFVENGEAQVFEMEISPNLKMIFETQEALNKFMNKFRLSKSEFFSA